MLKLALSRNRAPMGGRAGLLAVPASWRAGQMNEVSVDSAVMRMAWVMEPDCTSSSRSRPGRIGRPAASADVHPAGRSAFELRFQIAPDTAVEPDALYCAPSSS